MSKFSPPADTSFASAAHVVAEPAPALASNVPTTADGHAASASASASAAAAAPLLALDEHQLDLIVQQSAAIELAMHKLPPLSGWVSKSLNSRLAVFSPVYFYVLDFNLFYSEARIERSDGDGLVSDAEVRCLPLVQITSVTNAVADKAPLGRFDVHWTDAERGESATLRCRCDTDAERDSWVTGLGAHKRQLDSMLKFNESLAAHTSVS